jgi:predicted sulfurtransferase
MNVECIKCKNDYCNIRFRVEAGSLPKPMLFCSQTCLNLLQGEKLDPNFNYEDPKEVRELVQNLIAQTKQMQQELQDLRRIKKTYLGIFKDRSLKNEAYDHDRTFEVMNTQSIKCKNDDCNNQFRVEVNNETKPILYCSQTCLYPHIIQDEKLDPNFNYEDPKEVRELVQNLIAQTKQIQNELQDLRRIRKTYFELFSDNILKKEIYKRNWSFEDEANE